MGLYVETLIRAGMDELWERSQDPAQHQRWDLRFTSIDYLPKREGEPQRFRYATRVLPFLSVDGTGVSAGERRRDDGTRVSALRFASGHPLSLLAEGSGYWRYVPGPDGIRFLTGYDYRPRWGRFGSLADRLVFRPLMGWATAWSFDRLRLWCERGITPRRTLARAIGESALRALLCAAALICAPLPAALLVLVAAVALPPLPGTPAARRCLRTPPGRTPATAPRLLSTLEPS
uniref:Membrane protein YndG n=1 Tax=Streptomyces sp. NBC_00049 TaxID=2903617 RepID=A0AAU2JXA5_9ACTN